MGVLDDKVAIVTGSARGIGRATAELLSEHGAKVVINDLDARRRAGGRRSIDGETVVYGGDLTAEGAPEQLVQTAIDAWGRIDIIVNNAGYTLDAPIHKLSDDSSRRCSTSTSSCPFRVIRAAAPHLREPAKPSASAARRSSARSSTSPRSPARWATPARPTTRPARRRRRPDEDAGQGVGPVQVNCNAVAFGYIETRLTASKDESNVMEIGGEQVQLGIPDQLRGMAPMLIPLGRPAPRRRPPAACSSCARRGRTSSTARCSTSPAASSPA
jgi:3-oxoacyl-[acyl-carrier protein] reductase